VVSNLKTFSSLKFPDFRNYYFGTLFSEVGTQMQVVAVNWQIYEITRSAASLGFVGLSAFLAVIIFSLPSGLIVDKLNRKKVLLFSQIFPCFVALTLTMMSYFHTINPLAIYILVFLSFAALAFQGNIWEKSKTFFLFNLSTNSPEGREKIITARKADNPTNPSEAAERVIS
jgi:MFS family permease